jgi:hypothetical protein
MCENILGKIKLTEVQENKEAIICVLQDEFWDVLTFNDVEFLVVKIAPLMKYYTPIPEKIIQIDAPDVVLLRESYQKEAKARRLLHQARVLGWGKRYYYAHKLS